MKKIGFFGGTFDPIHFGHLFLALQLAEASGLDEVWVCPAFCSPFKKGSQPKASPSDRLEMVRLAIEEISRFKVLSLEVEVNKISYTIDTIRALPQEEYRLLLSEESAAHFSDWKEASELARLAPPLIGCREGVLQSSHSKRDRWKNIPYLREAAVPTKTMQISSTEIRERLKKKLYCGHLVPAKALDYIHRHGLYLL